LGIGDWGLGPIPNPQSPIPTKINRIDDLYIKHYYITLLSIKTLNIKYFNVNNINKI